MSQSLGVCRYNTDQRRDVLAVVLAVQLDQIQGEVRRNLRICDSMRFSQGRGVGVTCTLFDTPKTW